MTDYDDEHGERGGQQLGNYRLIRLLGEGGFADVYLGEHLLLNTHAALKILRIKLTESALQDFLAEARVIARLEHPHIVRVLECGVKGRSPFLVMAYAPNGTLRQRYPKGFRLQPTEVLSYVQQIASALDYAHQEKLVHRDIKPENLLLGRNNEVLLSDFGLVVLAQTTGSQTTKEMAGTVPYMAPEQLHGRPRQASDQYALGIVVYEWLSGERPFQGSFPEIVSQHLIAPPPPLHGRVEGISPAIESVVFKALAKDPQQRFASVREFAIAFDQVCKPTQQFSESLHNVTLQFSPSKQATVINTSIYSESSPTYMEPPQSFSEQSTIINTPSTQVTFVKIPSKLSQQPDVMDTPSRQSTLEFDPSNHPIQPSNPPFFKPEARLDRPMPSSTFPPHDRRCHLWPVILSVVAALILIIASILFVYARRSPEYLGLIPVTATSITQAITTATHDVKPSVTVTLPPKATATVSRSTPMPSPTATPTPSPTATPIPSGTISIGDAFAWGCTSIDLPISASFQAEQYRISRNGVVVATIIAGANGSETHYIDTMPQTSQNSFSYSVSALVNGTVIASYTKPTFAGDGGCQNSYPTMSVSRQSQSCQANTISWSINGGTADRVYIYRNGVLLTALTSNPGSFTDSFGNWSGGGFAYHITAQQGADTTALGAISFSPAC